MKRSAVVLGVVGACVVALVGGCATYGGGGASDEECIDTVLKAWEASILEVNVDKMMAIFSEDFSHDGYDYPAADKEALGEFIADGVEQGYFDGVEITFGDADIVIDGDTATVYPIDYVNDLGAVTVELVLKKEKAGWLISDMTIEGL